MQIISKTVPLAMMPSPPDGSGIRNFLTDVQAKKAPKGGPVENLKLGRVIRQVVRRLQDKNFEQQDDIVSLQTNSGLSVYIPGLFKRQTKNPLVDRLVDLG